MGAINQAFNQGLGSVAAAATIISGAKEQDISQALLGKEQSYEADAELTKLSGESEAAGKTLDKASAAEKDAGKFMRSVGRDKSYSKADKAEAKKMYKKALTEKEAAQRSFEELQDKIAAKRAMKQRAEMMIKKADKWGGIK